MISVLVVDDHDLVRDTVSAVLRAHAGIDVVGACASGLQAVELFRILRPDVVVMDLSMPGMGGVEATRQLRLLDANASVVVLTSARFSRDIDAALDAGALTYVTKDAHYSEIVRAVVAAAAQRREPAASMAVPFGAAPSIATGPSFAPAVPAVPSASSLRRWWRRATG
jgi:DNA-binding NarL/FixJ family response regulator